MNLFIIEKIQVQSWNGNTSTSTWEHQRLWSGGWIGLKYITLLLDWPEIYHFLSDWSEIYTFFIGLAWNISFLSDWPEIYYFVIGLAWNISFCYWIDLKYLIHCFWISRLNHNCLLGWIQIKENSNIKVCVFGNLLKRFNYLFIIINLNWKKRKRCVWKLTLWSASSHTPYSTHVYTRSKWPEAKL